MKEMPRHQIPRLQRLINAMGELQGSQYFASVNPKIEIHVLVLTDLGITYRGNPIRNIRFISEFCRAEDASNSVSVPMHFVLSFADGAKMVADCDEHAILLLGMDIPTYINELVSFFHLYARPDGQHEIEKSSRTAWPTVPLERFYHRSQVTEYYQELYQMYAQHILKMIQKDNSNRPIFLVEPGCGDGRCSKFITDYITTHTSREVYAAGFDINADNVALAKAKFAETKQFFIKGHFTEIASFLVDVQPLHHTLQDPLTVVIFSGVLCHVVADGSRQSLRMMQQACRALSPSLTIIGNHTTSFISKYMMSRTGMQIAEQSSSRDGGFVKDGVLSTKEVYFLQPQSAEQTMLKQIVWSDKRSPTGAKNNLDLSLCVHPIQSLQNLAMHHAQRLQTVTQLDLSDALLQSSEIAQAAELICQTLPNLTRVLFTKTDHWSLPFSQALSAYFPKMSFMNRLDSPDADTVPPFSPQMARGIKLFAAMPHEILHVLLPKDNTALAQSTKRMGNNGS